MSNHSDQPYDPIQAERLRKELDGLVERHKEPHADSPLDEKTATQIIEQIGPTGRFPNGKLTETDEGEFVIRLRIDQGTIILEFGKPVAWLGMRPIEARALADLLTEQALEVELATTPKS